MPVKKESPVAPTGADVPKDAPEQAAAAVAVAAPPPQTPPAQVTQAIARTPRTGLTIMPSMTAVEVRSAAADNVLTRGGKLPRVATTVTLRASQGHIFTIDNGETWNISADGYLELNKVNGLQFVPMPEVAVDGRMLANPHIVYDVDPNTQVKTLGGIYLRGALIGRDLLGTVRIVQESFFFDPVNWFTLAVLKACDWRKPKKAGQGPEEEYEEATTGEGNWTDVGRLVNYHSIKRPLTEHECEVPIIPGMVSALLDLRNYRVRQLVINRVARERDFTRIAQTILMRRLFRAHPGCESQRLRRGSVHVVWGEKQGKKKRDGGYWMDKYIHEATIDIPVLGWIDDGGRIESKLADQLRRGEEMMAEATAQSIKTEVTDLGMADLRQETEREEAEAANDSPDGTESAGTTDAHRFAQASLGQLARIDGGAPFAVELKAKWLPNGKAIAELTEQEAGRLVDSINNVIENLRERAAMKGGAS